LTGHLDLSDFVNLETLDCCYNELTSLDLSNNHKLGALSCHNNRINSLEISNLKNL